MIDVIGNFRTGATDVFDVYDYEQDPEKFRSFYENAGAGTVLDQVERSPDLQKWQRFRAGTPEDCGGWGYGDAPKTEAEFLSRYRGLTDALLDNPAVLGFHYTQLFDVEQEQNGLMIYDRRFKFDPELIQSINVRAAAIEKRRTAG